MTLGISRVAGRVVPIAGDDIDTDRIVPARYLRCVTFDKLGDALFRDDRDAEGATHPLDDRRFAGASLMLVGRNFGCGSSREHAPQAIVRAGFKGVLGESFGEIFAGNSLALGLVCVTAERHTLDTILECVAADPAAALSIDVAASTATLGNRTWAVTLPESARSALLDGSYDPLNELLANAATVDETAAQLPYLTWCAP